MGQWGRLGALVLSTAVGVACGAGGAAVAPPSCPPDLVSVNGFCTSPPPPQVESDPKAPAVAASSHPAAVAPGRQGESGCADGEREGFIPATAFPRIAGCAGGWALPGLRNVAPKCDHRAGDDSENPSGAGCSAADLCKAGWHVCRDFADVAAHSATQSCDGAVAPDSTEKLFFATSQSGPGACRCGDGDNNLFGCGNLGADPHSSCGAAPGGSAGAGCGNMLFSADLCVQLGAAWSCGTDDSAEARNVVKRVAQSGGVACCKD